MAMIRTSTLWEAIQGNAALTESAFGESRGIHLGVGGLNY